MNSVTFSGRQLRITDHCSQFYLYPRCRHDYLRAGKFVRERSAHPLDCGRVTVYKKNFFWRKLFGIIDKRLACRVCAELELFDVAADALRRFIGIECYFAALARLAQKAGRRLWTGIADEKDRMLRVLDDSPRKNVR